MARIRFEAPGSALEVVACDLSSQRSTRDAVAEIRAAHERIDLVIANAGVMAMPEARTEDGWELQLATNHLGHFTLVGLLLDRMLTVPGSRVVSITSNAHKFGRIRFEDLQAERRYGPWRAYAQSKLANLLFARELSRRLLAASAETIAGAAHPGYAATELQGASAAHAKRHIVRRVYGWGERLVSQPAAAGALPTLYAATSPHMVGGMLIGPADFFEMRGAPQVVVPAARAQDDGTARRLWRVSAELTGVTYPV